MRIFIPHINLLCLLLLTTQNVFAQVMEEKPNQSTIGVNLGSEFDYYGHTYGLIIEYAIQTYATKSNSFTLGFGLQEDFQVQLEKGFTGASGSTLRNGVHLLIIPSFHLLKSRKLNIRLKYFGGWSFKSTDGKIVNKEFNINRSYQDQYHYFSHGIMFQTGYQLTKTVSIEPFVKIDFRRWTDGDQTSQYPDLLYGIGFIKKLN